MVTHPHLVLVGTVSSCSVNLPCHLQRDTNREERCKEVRRIEEVREKRGGEMEGRTEERENWFGMVGEMLYVLTN